MLSPALSITNDININFFSPFSYFPLPPPKRDIFLLTSYSVQEEIIITSHPVLKAALI